eukprot:1160800-Pelagomonas_calceolata.AAC.9
MLLKHQLSHLDNPLKHSPLASVPLQKAKCSFPSPCISKRRWSKQAKLAAVCFAAKMGGDAAYLGMDFGTSGARATVIDGESLMIWRSPTLVGVFHEVTQHRQFILSAFWSGMEVGNMAVQLDPRQPGAMP